MIGPSSYLITGGLHLDDDCAADGAVGKVGLQGKRVLGRGDGGGQPVDRGQWVFGERGTSCQEAQHRHHTSTDGTQQRISKLSLVLRGVRKVPDHLDIF